MRKNLIIAVALLACCAAPPISLGSNSLKGKDLPNFESVSPHLFRGGQPTAHGLTELQAMGVKTIISLRHNRSQVLWEQKEVESLGIKFKRIPLDGLHQLSQANIKEFFKIVQDPANQPVFVHCQWGLDRTGALVGIYRQEVQNWSAKDAYNEMVDLGFETKYVWLADSVFDYEEQKSGQLAQGRPMGAKAIHSMHSMFRTRPKPKAEPKVVTNNEAT